MVDDDPSETAFTRLLAVAEFPIATLLVPPVPAPSVATLPIATLPNATVMAPTPTATLEAPFAFTPYPAPKLDVDPILELTPLSKLQLAVPVPPAVLTHVNVPHPPLIGKTVITFAPLVWTVTAPFVVAILTILK
jgi:hypothetical protein